MLDARDLATGPVARVRLPRRVPAGLHGSWMPSRTAT
ncbi:carotenoid oxygenase family protein [Achromobacter animicus]